MSITNEETLAASIENLFQIVKSNKCNQNDKTDAYLTLFRHVQSNQIEFINSITKQSKTVFTVVQNHIQSKDRPLSEAAITFLGHSLALEEFTSVCKNDHLENVFKILCDVLEKCNEKTTVLRILWCFCHQVAPKEVIKDFVENLVTIIGKFREREKLKSETVTNEGLKVIKRLCEQCPQEMGDHADKWVPDLINSLTTNIPKNQEVALSVLEAGIRVFLQRREFIQLYLTEKLNNSDFCQSLNLMFTNGSAPVHVLNVWACLLRLLEESFFNLQRVKVTNPLLKIAEKSFAAKQPEVTLALNNMWRALIDAVFTRPNEFGKRMEKIFLLPLKIRYKNEIVSQETLKTQWHLLCCIKQKINNYIEEAVFSIFNVYLKTDGSDGSNNLSTKNINDVLGTPDQKDRRKSTPRTPKSPFVVQQTVKILVAEMMLQLLTPLKDRHALKSLRLENFNGPCISNEMLIKHSDKFINFAYDLTLSCSKGHESTISNLWFALLVRLRQFSEEHKGKAVLQQIWSPIVGYIKEFVDHWLFNSISILKLCILIPESFLKVPIPDTLQNGHNEEENMTMFLVRLLLHKNFIDNEGYEQERFFILYERAIGITFSSLTGQLVNTEKIFTILEDSHSYLKNQDVRWRLWSTLTSLLQSYVTKTNDVSQDVDNDFSAILKSLVYPVKSIDLSKLQEGTFNELLKVWREIFEAFTRGVCLLSGVETNLAVETFFKDIKSDDIIKNITDNKTLSKVAKMVTIALQYVDFSNLKPIYASSRLTPTKVTKRLCNPMGNFASFTLTVKDCIDKAIELLPQGRTVEVTLIEILEVLETLYGKLESDPVVVASLAEFCPYLAKLLDPKMKFSSKITVKSEKVTIQLLSSLENFSNVIYDEDLLSKVEIVLVKTLAGSRKQLRNRVAQFWNRTFGKKSGLSYSGDLKEVLTKHQMKLNLLIPGLKKNPISSRMEEASIMDDTAQFPESLSSQSGVASPKLKNVSNPAHASPVKIHGSFLGLGKKSPKLGSPSNVLGNFLASGSSKNSPKSPFKNSPSAAKNVRRKLPISMEDSCDFVEIKDSPGTVKKKRLLTEHQKEIRRERKELPVMYNTLDNSQDTSVMRPGAFSQDLTQMSQDAFFKLPEKPVDAAEPTNDESGVKVHGKTESPLSFSNQTVADRKETTVINPSSSKVLEMELLNKSDTTEKVKNTDEKENTTDIIPSSQTQQEPSSVSPLVDSQTHSKRRKSVLKSNTKGSALVGLSQVVPGKVEDEEEVFDQKNRAEVDDSNVVLLSEDIELFDAPTVKEPIETLSDDNSTGTTSSDPPLPPTIDMEPKIVVDKLPNKRKRTLPTARRTGHKKRKAEAESNELNSKENKVPSEKRRRRNSVAVTSSRSKETEATTVADDVFDFSPDSKKKEKDDEVEPAKLQRRRVGRSSSKKRKSMPAFFKSITIDKNSSTVKEENEVGGKKREIKEPPVRPVPQLDNIIGAFSNDNKEETPMQQSGENQNHNHQDDSQEKALDGEMLAMDIDDIKRKTIASVVINDETIIQNESKDFPPKPKQFATGSPIRCEKAPSDVLSSPSLQKDVRVSSPLSRSVPNVSSSLSKNRFHVSSPLSRNMFIVSSPLSRKGSVVVSSPIAGKHHNVCSRTSSPISSKSVESKLVMKSPYVNYSTCIPTPALPGHVPSPCASPATSILKKRMGSFALGDVVDSPSPPNKRRVSFQLPSGTILSCEEIENNTDNEEVETGAYKNKLSSLYTSLRKKSKNLQQSQRKKKELKDNKDNNNSNNTTAIFPDLVKCTAPIDRILPSLTFSRGVGHLIRAQNIKTVGDLSALTEHQIEALPIHSPKVATVRSALRSFNNNQMSRETKTPALKSPLVVKGNLNDDSLLDSITPTKDDISLVEEAALLLTPSRHNNEDEVKRISLFNEPAKTTPKCALVIDLSDKGDNVATEHSTNNNENYDDKTNKIRNDDDDNFEELPCTPPVADDGKGEEIATSLTPPYEEDNREEVFENETSILPEVELHPPVDCNAVEETYKDLPASSSISGDVQMVTKGGNSETIETATEKKSGKPTGKSFVQFLNEHQLELDSLSNEELLELHAKLESIKTTVFGEIGQRMRPK